MKKSTKFLALASVALLAASCGGREGWSVEGTIAGAPENCRMAVEANNAGHWYVVDSVDVASGSGKFAYNSPVAANGTEILRLAMPGKGYIYFPVDSVDAVTVTAEAAAFGKGHALGGTPLAAAVARVDSIVSSGAAVDEIGKALASVIAADTTGTVAFYAVGKSLNGKPVFDPAESFGNRVYGAAAQVFATYHPLDPRGQALRQTFFAGRKALGRLPEPEQRVIEVPETGLFDIVRYDNKGVSHSLAELASKGKPVILSFTAYGLENSPAYNAVLYELYNKYRDSGLEIYQIAFDSNEVAWKEAALNIPWVTVWNSPADGNTVLLQYNVGALPMTYLINRNGDLGKRVVNPADLPKEVSKLF